MQTLTGYSIGRVDDVSTAAEGGQERVNAYVSARATTGSINS